MSNGMRSAVPDYNRLKIYPKDKYVDMMLPKNCELRSIEILYIKASGEVVGIRFTNI